MDHLSPLEAIGLCSICLFVAYLVGSAISNPPTDTYADSNPFDQPESEEPEVEIATCIGHVRGQQLAKNAMLLAAMGRHNVLLIGPPRS